MMSVLWNSLWVLDSFKAVSSLLLLHVTRFPLHSHTSVFTCFSLLSPFWTMGSTRGRCRLILPACYWDSNGVSPLESSWGCLKGVSAGGIQKSFTKSTIQIRKQWDCAIGGLREAQRLGAATVPARGGMVCFRGNGSLQISKGGTPRETPALWDKRAKHCASTHKRSCCHQQNVPGK